MIWFGIWLLGLSQQVSRTADQLMSRIDKMMYP